MSVVRKCVLFKKNEPKKIKNNTIKPKTNMTKKNLQENNGGRYPFDVAGTFWGIRNSALSFSSSLFELIDNSLDHGKAETVDIRLEWLAKNTSSQRNRLKKVAIIDDGNGMDDSILFDALITGKSLTFNRRESIGRFGFGLKASGLNQCRLIEIYSKTNNGDSYYAVLNYNEFLNGKQFIDAPIEKEIPKEYHDIIKKHGTVVIWSDLDIAQPMNDDDLEELRYNIGRTYRKFIGEEILVLGKNGKSNRIENQNKRTIIVNGFETLPLDPLYYTKIPGYSKDKKSEIYYEAQLSLPIHAAEELEDSSVTEGKITIRMSLLPKEWRLARNESARSDFAYERYIDRNEGISILRNGREVLYDKVSGIGPRKEPEDRWWGMEIEYPATLDQWFQVKNVKVGLEPNKELREKIDAAVRPTIKRCREIIASDFTKHEVEKEKEEKKKPSTGGHSPAEDRFKETGLGRPRIFEALDEDEKDEYYKQLSSRFADFDARVDRARFEELNVKWFNDYDLPEKGPFIDINAKLGITELSYNIKHVFFRRLNEIMEKLEEIVKIKDEGELMDAREEISASVNQLRYSIDLLLGSYTSAHVSMDPYAKQEVKTTLMYLLQQWTTMLQIVTDDPNFYKRVNG